VNPRTQRRVVSVVFVSLVALLVVLAVL